MVHALIATGGTYIHTYIIIQLQYSMEKLSNTLIDILPYIPYISCITYITYINIHAIIVIGFDIDMHKAEVSKRITSSRKERCLFCCGVTFPVT